MLDKYGGIGLQSKQLKDNSEVTNFKKYGCKNVFESMTIKNKSKKTKLKKYGNRYYSNPIKTKHTVLKKYGVDCVLKLKNIRDSHKENTRVNMINSIFSGNRLNDSVIPMFVQTDYSTVNNQYKFKCTVCKSIFTSNLDDGKIPRCNTCFPLITKSLPEYEIINFLKQHIDTEIIHGARGILSGKRELDIYIPNKKIAIEFNGIYWHSELSGGKDKNYHLNKTIECESLGIKLIHIFEDDWINKSEIIKSRLLNILNKSEKIYARMCNVKKINHKTATTFLVENHLQGKDTSTIQLGLFFNEKLIAVMTFGKLRMIMGNKNTIKSKYEMYRFCSVLGYSIVGGASKLFKYFIKTYFPTCVISYADYKMGRGKLYNCLNFNEVSITHPNYWYTNDYNNRIYRYNFAKHTLSKKLANFNPNLSE